MTYELLIILGLVLVLYYVYITKIQRIEEFNKKYKKIFWRYKKDEGMSFKRGLILYPIQTHEGLIHIWIDTMQGGYSFLFAETVKLSEVEIIEHAI